MVEDTFESTDPDKLLAIILLGGGLVAHNQEELQRLAMRLVPT